MPQPDETAADVRALLESTGPDDDPRDTLALIEIMTWPAA